MFFSGAAIAGAVPAKQNAAAVAANNALSLFMISAPSWLVSGLHPCRSRRISRLHGLLLYRTLLFRELSASSESRLRTSSPWSPPPPTEGIGSAEWHARQ
jgi:hypothetical protein